MTNEEKALELCNDPKNDYKSTADLCVMMANWKDEQLKNHEQSLLWTFESILDKIVPDGESYNIAINEFKNQLINKYLENRL